jgi:hypothetical protein
MTRRFRVYFRPARGEQWAFCRRRWQQSKRSAAWRAGAVRMVQRCAGKVRVVLRLAGKARCAARKRNYRGRNDRRRMKIVAKTRDEPMQRAWARSRVEKQLQLHEIDAAVSCYSVIICGRIRRKCLKHSSKSQLHISLL